MLVNFYLCSSTIYMNDVSSTNFRENQTIGINNPVFRL